MKFIHLSPGGTPEAIELEKIGLADLQHYVEGYVESPYVPGLNEQGIVLWANEEGPIHQMRPNLLIEHSSLFEPMLIVGPVVFTSLDDDTGETTGLTDEQVEKVKTFVDQARMTFPKALRAGLVKIKRV